MSSLYNTCSLQPSTRVGNWVEEDALRAATGTIRNDSWVEDRVERRDRVKLADTGSRVVYHSENLSPKEYMTETQAAQDPSFGKRSFQVSTGLPPRAARETQRFTLAASQRVSEPPKEVSLSSTTRSTFAAPPPSVYEEPKGRRVMKTAHMEDLPQNCRDTKFLRSHFIGTVAPRIPREKASGLLPKGDYLMQSPITYYSSRVAEGVVNATESRGPNPFAKSSKFSLPVDDATRRHNESQDLYLVPPEKTKLSVTTKAAGAGLSFENVIERVKRALSIAAAGDSLDDIRRLFHMIDTSGDGKVSDAELRVCLRRLGVNILEADIAAVMTAFDEDGSGKLSVDELFDALESVQ